MNSYSQAQHSRFPVDTVIRVAAGAATIVAVFVLGYSAPVDRVFAQDTVEEERAEAPTGNGPTGYFPDMFEEAARAAEPAEPIETF